MAQTIYQIPSQSLSDGYSLQGEIALDGSVVTDWRVEVDGPVPYEFTSASPSALAIGFQGSAGLLSLDGSFGQLSAQDNRGPDCQACVQTLSWSDTSIQYQHADFADNSPSVVAVASREPGPIATVPEPSGFLCILAVGLVCLGFCHGRSLVASWLRALGRG